MNSKRSKQPSKSTGLSTIIEDVDEPMEVPQQTSPMPRKLRLKPEDSDSIIIACAYGGRFEMPKGLAGDILPPIRKILEEDSSVDAIILPATVSRGVFILFRTLILGREACCHISESSTIDNQLHSMGLPVKKIGKDKRALVLQPTVFYQETEKNWYYYLLAYPVRGDPSIQYFTRFDPSAFGPTELADGEIEVTVDDRESAEQYLTASLMFKEEGRKRKNLKMFTQSGMAFQIKSKEAARFSNVFRKIVWCQPDIKNYMLPVNVTDKSLQKFRKLWEYKRTFINANDFLHYQSQFKHIGMRIDIDEASSPCELQEIRIIASEGKKKDRIRLEVNPEYVLPEDFEERFLHLEFVEIVTST